MYSSNEVYEMEKILFWFYQSQKQRSIVFCNKSVKIEREYSIDDTAILIKRMLMSGRISPDHLKVFQCVAKRGFVPDERNLEEVLEAKVWNEFVEVILEQFLQRGWLEKSSCKIA